MPCLPRSITTMLDNHEVLVGRFTRQPRRKCHKTCHSATFSTRWIKFNYLEIVKKVCSTFALFCHPNTELLVRSPALKYTHELLPLFSSLWQPLLYGTVTENLPISSHFKAREFHLLRDDIYSVHSELGLHKTWWPCSGSGIVITFPWL